MRDFYPNSQTPHNCFKFIDRVDFTAYKSQRSKFYSPNGKRIVPLLQREMIEGQKFTSIMKLLDSASAERKSIVPPIAPLIITNSQNQNETKK